jgi:hypothetical protein
LVKGLLVVLALWGCKGGDDSGGPSDAQVDAAIDAPVGMAMIGPEGGAIASADGIALLTIPPGAVSTPIAFTLDLVPQTQWPPSIAEWDPVGTVYAIGPEGTTFASPATLTWTFATTPAGARDPMNRPRFLLGHSRSAADVIAPHVAWTQSNVGSGGQLIVESRISHLSEHFLSAYTFRRDAESTYAQIGSAVIELGAGAHAVDVPWDAKRIEIIPSDVNDVYVNAWLSVRDPVVDESSAEWQRLDEPESGSPLPAKGWSSGPHAFSIGVPWSPSPLPRFKCAAEGTTFLGLTLYTRVSLFLDEVASSVYMSDEVTCIEREQKPEYTNEVALLGANRIAPASVPSTSMVDLEGATAMGLFGYNIILQPGQTIRVCVTTNGSTGLTYYPRYPPGFTFVDGSPGCTDITNLDPNNPNEVLLKLSGSGTNVTITVSVP